MKEGKNRKREERNGKKTRENRATWKEGAGLVSSYAAVINTMNKNNSQREGLIWHTGHKTSLRKSRTVAQGRNQIQSAGGGLCATAHPSSSVACVLIQFRPTCPWVTLPTVA